MRSLALFTLCLTASCSSDSPAPDALARDLAPGDSAGERRATDLGATHDGKVADAPIGKPDQSGPPPSCPPKPLGAGDHALTIDFGGKTRDYDLHIPKAVKAGVAAPLVLDFHGFTSDKVQQRWLSGFLHESDARGFIVAHPNGYGAARSWNAGAFCCGQAVAEKLDDVGLAKAIVQQIAGKVCVDAKRVYATGISNGGMLSHRLACEASSVFAAVAPVAGRIDIPIASCAPGRPVSVIAFHGNNDELVPYLDAKNAIAHWVKVDGCTDAGSVTFSKGKSSCTTYSSCKAGTHVSFCTLDAGHISYWNGDNVTIAPLAWAFLSKFTLP